MKRIISVSICLAILLSVSAFLLCSCQNEQPQTEETSAQPQTEAPDLTSIHGYFEGEDNNIISLHIYFRGQEYSNTLLSQGELILGRLDGKAYITSKNITDDSQAEKEGVMVEFDNREQIPEILRMRTKDYFGDTPYDEKSYPEFTYLCKKEQWSILGQKIRTQAFNNMYVTYIEEVSFLGTGLFNMTVGGHEMLDDETTAVINNTVKNETDDTLDMQTVYSSDYNVFIVHRCDKNMLVDPLNDEYIIIKTTDDEYYIGDWYSVAFNRVSEENEKLIADLMEKYSDTVELMTDIFKELYFTDQSQAAQS